MAPKGATLSRSVATDMSISYDKTHLSAKDWMVETIPLSDARELIAKYHYSGGSANTAVFRHGLFRRENDNFILSGAILWMPPTKTAAQATLRQMKIEGDWRRVLSLSRLAIVPDAPTNAASFLIGRSIRLIKKTRNWDVLVTYADERYGHTGAIYKATNWTYLGKYLAKNWSVDGKQISRKVGPRSMKKKELLALGAIELPPIPKHKFGMVIWN
jgi:hypothetical protein